MALAQTPSAKPEIATDIPRKSDSKPRENEDPVNSGGKGSARRTVRSAARRSPQRLAALGAAYVWPEYSNG
jgi:hypothetical protein